MKLNIRIQPAEDEALGGYLQRLADSNGRSLLSLYPYIKPDGKKTLKQDDIPRFDYYPGSILDFNKLEQVIRLDVSKLKKHSFWQLLNLFVHDDEISSTKIMRDMLRKYYAFCPQCLKETKYRKLLWNVSAIGHCHVHKQRLIECCPCCKRIIRLAYLHDCCHCPYCRSCLFLDKMKQPEAGSLKYEKFIWNAITEMCSRNSDSSISGQDVAIKLIYILNELSEGYDYEHLKRTLGGKSNAESLLQQARGTSRRRVHLSQVLDLLFARGMTVDAFLTLDVPNCFRSEIIRSDNQAIKTKPSRLKPKRIVIQPSRKYDAEIPDRIDALCRSIAREDKPITIGEVSRRMGISENTLRKWKLNVLINKHKVKQCELIVQNQVLQWERKIEEFMRLGKGDILSKEIYDYLGVKPSYIRHRAPELISRLQELRQYVRESQRRFNKIQ